MEIFETGISAPVPPGLADAEYEAFSRAFCRLSGIRLDLYKEKQMRRRINTLIERKRLNAYRDFMKRLETRPDELAEFIDYITINVTEFFRTQEHWEAFERELESRIIPSSRRPLKVWSCACATGEEPYSLAVTLLKYLPRGEFRILATDIDEKVLKKAKAGCFDERSISQLPRETLERYFVRTGDLWRVSDELKSCVEFGKMDLLVDEYPQDYDLIVCRNVLIYFTDEAKDAIYLNFNRALRQGGCLFTGNAEQIVYYKKYGFQKIRSFIYSKI